MSGAGNEVWGQQEWVLFPEPPHQAVCVCETVCVVFVAGHFAASVGFPRAVRVSSHLLYSGRSSLWMGSRSWPSALASWATPLVA